MSLRVVAPERTGQQQLLGRHPVASSTDPAVIRNAVNELTHDEHLVELHQGHHLQGLVHGTRLGPIAFANVSYGAGVTIKSPPSGERILVVIPRGPMFVESSSRQWMASTPFALSSTEYTLMVPDPMRGALVGALDASAAGQRFSSISGRQLQRQIHLDSERPLQLAAPELFARTWVESCRIIDQDDAAGQPSFEEALLGTLFSTLLLGLGPHLKCFEPHPGVGPVRPAYLEAALDFIKENHPQIAGIDSVAAAVGISPRQLQTVFMLHVGTSPARHLREVRLIAARDLLREGNPGARPSVSSVAARVGFEHLGRFSAYYTKRFGEPPSRTLARHQTGLRVSTAASIQPAASQPQRKHT
ncbi:AraC family transcriptional regulator [Paeniglutamicibacter sp. NPDC091659]|uniref:AraC family transcriptional regulator n=1 Tax=Paeniglutamicibacter sp. NPDC091659 TaxID=3364389 RepID=UPI0038017310